MATSKQPYPCFKFRDNGFPNIMVFLAGKDDSGKTIYVEEDGTGHVHKTKEQYQQTHQQQSTANATTIKEDTSGSTNVLLKIIIAELERLIKLFEKEEQQQQQNHK
jgi:hypothetical protein